MALIVVRYFKLSVMMTRLIGDKADLKECQFNLSDKDTQQHHGASTSNDCKKIDTDSKLS